MTEERETVAITSGVGIGCVDEHGVEQDDRARSAYDCTNIHTHEHVKYITYSDGAQTLLYHVLRWGSNPRITYYQRRYSPPACTTLHWPIGHTPGCAPQARLSDYLG